MHMRWLSHRKLNKAWVNDFSSKLWDFIYQVCGANQWLRYPDAYELQIQSHTPTCMAIGQFFLWCHLIKKCDKRCIGIPLNKMHHRSLSYYDLWLHDDLTGALLSAEMDKNTLPTTCEWKIQIHLKWSKPGLHYHQFAPSQLIIEFDVNVCLLHLVEHTVVTYVICWTSSCTKSTLSYILQAQ
jgi:hypothetical protein